MAELDVYLGPERAGSLRGDDEVRFAYAPSWLADGVAISHRLPLGPEPASVRATRVFFDGLLPEATLRSELARIWRLDPLDTYGLLAAIGRESAGAISVLPAGERMPAGNEVDWLDEEQLAGVIARLPRAPLGSDPARGIRVSLGGAQDKLVLVRDGRRWGLPHPGTPSTHIVKPDPQREWLPNLAVNEYVCCRWLAELGLAVASTDLITVDGRRVLISSRFDRAGAYPMTQRLHQEDFAQITGHLSLQKYEEHGGPSIADCLSAISAVSAEPIADRRAFIDAAWANALIGNADAHAKNYAMVLRGRAWRIAPMYDVICTLVYDQVDHGLAMRLDGKASGRAGSPDHLPASNLEQAFTVWGYPTARARRHVAERLIDLADRVIASTPDEASLGDATLTSAEEQHVALMVREIHRRARNLRRTAASIVTPPPANATT